jgi:predicted ArsR family transcriptional regulator
MKDILTLTDLGQLKALSDPFRQRILEGFSAKPATTKQVAERLGEKPTKLYHHVEILEQAGLVKLVETRPNRGTVEKYYHTTARKFAIDQRLLAVSSRARETTNELQAMVMNALQAGLDDAQAGFAAELFKSKSSSYPVAAAHTRVRVSPKQLAKLVRKIQEWGEQCQAADNKDGEIEYSFTLAFHPIKSKIKGGVQT